MEWRRKNESVKLVKNDTKKRKKSGSFGDFGMDVKCEEKCS